ncbi:MAG: flagellar biosynthesis protein FlhF [Candidatus Competibacteraceae bacterium]|nr:MAG: flagellar biosynthesis protein FlhF [Candidatus Competibacteraceae bacterium]
MKIKRLCASNIREAMRKVRDELGSEAVILSNQRTASGFEIVAAVDYDEKLLQGVQQQPVATPETVARSRDPAPEPPLAGQEVEVATAEAAPPSAPPSAPEPPAPVEAARDVKPRVVWSQDPLLVDMQSEIHGLRGLLEQQLAGLAWGDLARGQPRRAELLSQLLDFGFGPDLCLRLADAAAGEADLERGWRLALETLGRGLTVTQDDILSRGGIAALIGPTGVGKTTTIAKLAARYKLRHGPGRVALITTDSYRIGAFEQIRTFGMIMDTPARLVSSPEELRNAIAAFADKSLILIDTAGMGQRDIRLAQQFALFDETPQIRSYLVLAANAQHAVLGESVAAFSRTPLSGVILTKVDETTRLGAALSVIHDRSLPVAYLGNGQRVPEDLQVARVDVLIRMGEAFAGRYGDVTASEALALTFGRRLNAHAAY